MDLVMRFRLRTLLVVLAIGPPVLAGVWWALPHVLGLLAACYFGAGTVLFAAWWMTIRHEAETARQRALHDLASGKAGAKGSPCRAAAG
jgi:hypothetical protein